MGSHQLDELAIGLHELATAADELLADPPAGVDLETLRRVSVALAQARVAMADLEDQVE